MFLFSSSSAARTRCLNAVVVGHSFAAHLSSIHFTISSSRSSERSLGRPRVIGALVVRGSRKSREMRPSEHRKNRESAYCGKFWRKDISSGVANTVRIKSLFVNFSSSSLGQTKSLIKSWYWRGITFISTNFANFSSIAARVCMFVTRMTVYDSLHFFVKFTLFLATVTVDSRAL